MLKKFSIVFLLSLVIFLCVCWVRAQSCYLASYTFTLCYFAFTYTCLEKLKFQDIMKSVYMCIAIILGFTLIESPLYIMDLIGLTDFRSSMTSAMITLFTIISVLLALLCWIEKRLITTFLALVIIVLLNTCALPQWVNFVMERYH